MRIAWFGSSLVSCYWNGAATYYRGIVRALAERGHHVTFYEPDAYDRQAHRDIADPPWAEVIVWQPTQSTAEHLVRTAASADVVVKSSGIGVLDDVLECAVADLDGPMRIFWDVDAPATLSNLTPAFRSLVPAYDAILTYGGGDPIVAQYRELGARDCIIVYNALDPETHYPVQPEPVFHAELAFLGNRLPDREARVDEFFLRAAALVPERQFLFGGSGWEDKPLPRNVALLGHVGTADHNALNSTPLAVLNVTRDSMVRNGWSPPTRVFEAAGAGACVITDNWQGIDDFLEPGVEVLVADDGRHVASLIQGLTREHAKQIGGAALTRVLLEHTYEQRALQVEHVLAGSL
jgi:spore maturation protein CgeB